MCSGGLTLASGADKDGRRKHSQLGWGQEQSLPTGRTLMPPLRSAPRTSFSAALKSKPWNVLPVPLFLLPPLKRASGNTHHLGEGSVFSVTS